MIRYRKLDLSEDWLALKSFYIEYWKIDEDEAMNLLSQLPSDGIVAEDDVSGVIGAVFLYTTINSTSCITAFPVLSKKFKGDRCTVIKTMFDKLHTVAEYLGYSYVQTWSGLPFVQEHLVDIGYEVGDTNVNQYLKRL